jgi:hypothetical protein
MPKVQVRPRTPAALGRKKSFPAANTGAQGRKKSFPAVNTGRVAGKKVFRHRESRRKAGTSYFGKPGRAASCFPAYSNVQIPFFRYGRPFFRQLFGRAGSDQAPLFGTVGEIDL